MHASRTVLRKKVKENAVTEASAEQVASFGTSVIDRVVSELGATKVDEFPELNSIKNLKSEDMG